MKKLCFIIIALMLFSFKLPDVSAYSKGDLVGYHYDSKTDYTGYGLPFYTHYMKVSGVNKDIICLQPGFAAKRSGSNLYVRFKYTYDDPVDYKAYIAGIDKLQSKIAGDFSNVAATNAVRAFNMIWTNSGLSPGLNTGSGRICESDYCGHYRIAAYFYNRMVNYYPQTIKNATGKSLPGKASGTSSHGLSTNMKDTTVRYIEEALTAAKAVREADAYKNGTVKIDNLITPVEQKNSNGKHYKEHIRKVTLNTINPDTGAYLTFSCSSCEKRNIDYTIKASKNQNSGYQTLSKSNGKYKILLKSLGTEDGKGSFYLKITFSTSKDLNECKNTNNTIYYVNAYVTKADGADKELYVLANKDSKGNLLTPSNGYQNFLYVKKSDTSDSKTDYAKSQIKICGEEQAPSCDDLYNEYIDSKDTNTEKDLIKDCCNSYIKQKDPAMYAEKCDSNIPACEVKYNAYKLDKENELKILDLKDNCCPPKDGYLENLGEFEAQNFIRKYCDSEKKYDCITKVNDVKCNEKESVINITEGLKVNKTDCTYENKKNVLSCVLANKDFANNNYKAETDGLQSNPYCSFYCNEDYEITLPGIKKLDSGRKIYLEANISGIKTCYSDLIDYDKFEFDLEDAQVKAKNAYTAYQNSKTSTNKSKLDNANKKIDTIVEQYNSCVQKYDDKKKNTSSEFYKYNPKIKFNYNDEGFKNDIKNLEMAAVNTKFTDYSLDICYNPLIGDYYECNDSSTTTKSQVIEIVKYTTTGEKKEKIDISTATFVKHSQKVSAKYIFPDQYFIIPGSGAIASEKKDNYTPLGNYVPVSLTAKTGSYQYTLEIDDLGEYYSGSKKGELGRLWGDENSVFNKVLNTKGKDTCNEEVNDIVESKNSSINSGKYVCYYKINCPDCPTDCEPPCKICAGDCDTNCDNCIIVNGESNFSYRAITPENINPNNRVLGKNWKYNEKNIKTTTELKAYNTTNEIVSNGEKIYSDDSNEMVLEVKLKPDMIKSIKEYNEKSEVISKGGFANSTLECYPYVESGVTYNNVFCYSTYLDFLIEKYGSGPNGAFIFKKNRIPKANRAASTNQNSSKKNSYWTTWTDVLNSSRFTVNTSFEKYLDGAGPSYR